MPANGQDAAASQLNTAATWLKNTYNTVSNDVAAGVRKINGVIAGAVADKSQAPPKADAAPGGSTKYAYTGLCDAMNTYEQDLVKKGTVMYANQYVIEFAPKTLASSGVTLQGTTAYSTTPTQQSRTAKAVTDSNSNSVNNKGKTFSVSQGTQIIQFIEMIMRNSRYVTDQLKVTTDQVTGNSVASSSATSTKPTTWFKITVNAVPIGDKIDTKRHDYPYKITYTISTYAINEAQSQYFPDAQFRGVQKVYNYWFTGQNTQVLSYEQGYNTQYINVLSSKTNVQGPQSLNNDLAGSVGYGMGPNKNVPAPASAQSDQQAANGANNPASTLADYLYSQSDQSEITLQIVGDPAWLVQGEVLGITSKAFQFTGFYPDGTVNPDAQQVVFAVNWNAPADYDLDTGLMNVNATATKGKADNLSTSPPQASAAYTATSVKSTFSKGKFIQELKGNVLKNLSPKQLAAATAGAARNTTNTPVPIAPGSRSSTVADSNENTDQLAGAVASGTAWTPASNTSQQPADSSSPVSGEPVQLAPPAEQPTSNGDIQQTTDNPPPPKVDINSPVQANSDEAAAVKAYVDAGGTFPAGTGPVTSGPLYDAVASAKQSLIARQQAYAALANTNTQLMAPRDA
jgi:hypothetical protein